MELDNIKKEAESKCHPHELSLKVNVHVTLEYRFVVAVKPVSKYSAVLLPAEEVAGDSDGSHSPTWIPIDETEEKFYEETPELKSKKIKDEPAAKKIKKEPQAMSEDSEEEETITLDNSEHVS